MLPDVVFEKGIVLNDVSMVSDAMRTVRACFYDAGPPAHVLVAFRRMLCYAAPLEDHKTSRRYEK